MVCVCVKKSFSHLELYPPCPNYILVWFAMSSASPGVTWDLVADILVSFLVLVSGLVTIILVPSILQFLLGQCRCHVRYRPPNDFIRSMLRERAAQTRLRFQEEGYVTDEEAIFTAYYAQPFLRLTRRQRYWRSNIFFLLYMLIQGLLVIVLYLLIDWIVDMDPSTTLTATATIGVAFFALFHVGDYLRGIVAYIWCTATGTLQMGDEVDVEGRRGIVSDIGPIQTVVHVFMRNVGMVTQIPTNVAAAAAATTATTNSPPLPPPSIQPPSEQPRRTHLGRHLLHETLGTRFRRVAASPLLTMTTPGYVPLPLLEQYTYFVPTGSVLNTAFAHYDYA